MASYAIICNLGRINVANVLKSTFPKVASQQVIVSNLLERKASPANQGLQVSLRQPQWISTTAKLSSSHGDHSKLWTIERAAAVGLLAMVPTAFIFPNPALDYAMAVALTAHVHWGMEAIVIDYMRPRIVGKALAKVGLFSVYALSAFTLGSLFYFNYSDVGITLAVKMLWKL